MAERLTEHLVARGLLTPEAADEALERQVLMGGALDTALFELGLIEESALIEGLAAAYGLEVAEPADASRPVDGRAVRTLPEQWARKHRIAPLALEDEGRTLSVLTPAPADVELVVRLSELLETTIRPLLAPEFRVEERLALLYGLEPDERHRALIATFGGRLPSARPPSVEQEGTLDFAAAVARLRDPTSRDHIARTALRHIGRELEFVALFIVQDGFLEGWMARGPGSHQVFGASIAIDPDSAFRVVLDTRAHYLGPLAADTSHEDFVRRVGRPHPRSVLIVPLRIRDRTVALLYAENGPREIPTRVAADVMLFVSHVQAAMLTLLLRRKAASFSQLPASDSIEASAPPSGGADGDEQKRGEPARVPIGRAMEASPLPVPPLADDSARPAAHRLEDAPAGGGADAHGEAPATALREGEPSSSEAGRASGEGFVAEPDAGSPPEQEGGEEAPLLPAPETPEASEGPSAAGEAERERAPESRTGSTGAKPLDDADRDEEDDTPDTVEMPVEKLPPGPRRASESDPSALGAAIDAQLDALRPPSAGEGAPSDVALDWDPLELSQLLEEPSGSSGGDRGEDRLEDELDDLDLFRAPLSGRTPTARPLLLEEEADGWEPVDLGSDEPSSTEPAGDLRRVDPQSLEEVMAGALPEGSLDERWDAADASAWDELSDEAVVGAEAYAQLILRDRTMPDLSPDAWLRASSDLVKPRPLHPDVLERAERSEVDPTGVVPNLPEATADETRGALGGGPARDSAAKPGGTQAGERDPTGASALSTGSPAPSAEAAEGGAPADLDSEPAPGGRDQDPADPASPEPSDGEDEPTFRVEGGPRGLAQGPEEADPSREARAASPRPSTGRPGLEAGHRRAPDDARASVDDQGPLPRDGSLEAEVHARLQQLEHPMTGVRGRAREALAAMGIPAIPFMAERFPGPLMVNPFAPEVVLPAFAECGPVLSLMAHHGLDAHPHIAARLDAPDPVVRFFATYFYSSVYVPEAVPRLIQRLHDEEARICMTAARTLFWYRGHAVFQQVLDHLHGRLHASSAAARRHAAFLLGLFRDVTAVPELIAIIERKDRSLSDVAEAALAEITKQQLGGRARRWRAWWSKNADRNRIEWLIEGLSSKEPSVRRSAWEELRAVTGQSFDYDPDAGRRKREEARRRWQAWWKDEGSALF